MGWLWSFVEESDLRSTPQSCSQSSVSSVSTSKPTPLRRQELPKGKAQGLRDACAIGEGSLEEVVPMKSRHSPDRERIERAPQAAGKF